MKPREGEIGVILQSDDISFVETAYPHCHLLNRLEAPRDDTTELAISESETGLLMAGLAGSIQRIKRDTYLERKYVQSLPRNLKYRQHAIYYGGSETQEEERQAKLEKYSEFLAVLSESHKASLELSAELEAQPILDRVQNESRRLG